MSLKIAIIIGSTRPGRVGESVAKWFYNQVKNTNEVEFEVIDLVEQKLPLLDEPSPALYGKYENDATKKWSELIAGFDGYIWVTPEYNHSTSAALKNAIDYLYHEWSKKPVGIISYGSQSGVRAAEHLKQIALQLQMHPIFEGIYISAPWAAVDEKGDVKPENLAGDPAEFTKDLVWWAEILKKSK